MADIQEPRAGRGLRFDATVTLGHVLQLVAILVPVVAWGVTIETRLAIQATELAALQALNARDAATIEKRLDLIDAKLDRLLGHPAK
jgi:hypothetical protein